MTGPGRKAIAALLLSALWAGPALAWDVGFNFRATSGYVTDVSPSTFASMGVTTYPTVRTVNGQPITFGWESASPSSTFTRDRSSGVDSRLAGLNCQINNGGSSVFRVDLPALGTYSIGLALGDAVANNPQNNHVRISSTSVVLASVDVNTNQFVADATGAISLPAQWPTANVSIQKTFSSTILRVQLSGQSDSNSTCISHLRVTLVRAAQLQTARPGQFLFQ